MVYLNPSKLKTIGAVANKLCGIAEVVFYTGHGIETHHIYPIVRVFFSNGRMDDLVYSRSAASSYLGRFYFQFLGDLGHISGLAALGRTGALVTMRRRAPNLSPMPGRPRDTFRSELSPYGGILIGVSSKTVTNTPSEGCPNGRTT